MSISLTTSLLKLSLDTRFITGISEIYTYYTIFSIISETKIYGTSVLNIRHDSLFSKFCVEHFFAPTSTHSLWRYTCKSSCKAVTKTIQPKWKLKGLNNSLQNFQISNFIKICPIFPKPDRLSGLQDIPQACECLKRHTRQNWTSWVQTINV
jgi:hypothetical protein